MFFSSYSFGCRVNQAELENISQQLIKRGYNYNQNKPDFIIINSCAVTQKAEREARQLLYQLTKKHPQTKIYLTGCASTLWKCSSVSSRKYKVLSGIDINKNIIFIPNSQKQYIIETISQNFPVNNHSAIRQITNYNSKLLNSGRYLLKIQDGCPRYCSYCIVPFLRGKPHSKKIKDIVNEINHLSQNIKEVILTAINTEDFGKDNHENLVDLLKAILEQTKIERISFGSINPWSLTDDFLKYISSHTNSRFVSFFHIPIQSGSNKILKLMNRGYTTEEILPKLQKLQQISSYALIATDIIVGFPGETEEDFQRTLDFIRNSPISKVHIFPFSLRSGTRAESLTKKYKLINPKIISSRINILRSLSNSKFSFFQKKLIGKKFPALFLEKRVEDYQEALLSNNLLIRVNSKNDIKGEIIDVIILRFLNKNLIVTRY